MYPFINYWDSIHYRNSCSATIMIVKFLLLLSTMRPPFAAKRLLSFFQTIAAYCYGSIDNPSRISHYTLDLLI